MQVHVVVAESCCSVPFYIFPGHNTSADKHGMIVRVWGSVMTELIGVHQFQCDFPHNSTPEEKALFVGGMLLLNELFFKPSNRNDGNN